MLTYLTRNHFRVLLQLLIIFPFQPCLCTPFLEETILSNMSVRLAKRSTKTRKLLNDMYALSVVIKNHSPALCAATAPNKSSKSKHTWWENIKSYHFLYNESIEWVQQIFMSNTSVNYVICMNVNFKRKRCRYIWNICLLLICTLLYFITNC